MKKNQQKSRKRFSSAYSSLYSSVLSATLPDDEYKALIANLIRDDDLHGLPRNLDKLILTRRFRKHFAGLHTGVIEAAKNGLSIGGLSEERAWRLIRFTLQKNQELINEFTSFREGIDRDILNGSYDAALGSLENLKEKLGESIWYVRTKILLLSELKRPSDLANYSDHLQLGIETTLIGSILHYARVLTDTDSPISVLERIIFSTSAELKDTPYDEFASLLELLFTPQPLMTSRSYWPAILRLHALTAIDQYTILEKILRLALANNEFKQLLETDQMRIREFKQLVNETKIHALQKLYNALDQIQLHQRSEIGDRLIKNYELGMYGDVISIFNENHAEMQDPLNYANILAKSLVSNTDTEVSFKAPIIDRVTKHLKNIYALSKNTKNSLEALKSLAVRFNNAGWAPQLQLAVYKALPWKYEESGRNIAARLALLSSVEPTPYSLLIATSQSYFDESEVPGYCEPVPTYRILKRRALHAIDESPRAKFTEDLLDQYLDAEKRIKDGLETRVLYFLKSGRKEELLCAAARYLVDIESAYLVLPMERLIEIIETDGHASLEAVIVAFYYYRFVSQNKDYVLNESFEDLLLQHDISLPSELIRRDGADDKLSQVFYREICIPEVLDFLSCFNNIHELFAERVKILDELSERELIDSGTRSREVEDIVGRVIIETATTNLNGAKISVDESAIRKKIRVEIANLVTLFDQHINSAEERFTITLDQPVFGKAHGYLSGARNAIILRLCNLVMEAFMFDEKFGLDKALSGEIRHGFFSNLMHAKLEEKKLLAETDAKGFYLPNDHWREINHLVSKSGMEEIEQILNKFGEDLNSLIAEAENWMKIKTAATGGSALIEYELSKDDFDKIYAYVESEKDPDAICMFIFRILWEHIDNSLDGIRERLNGQFRTDLDGLFQVLETNLLHLTRHMSLVELRGAVSQVRNEVRDDISTAAEWFRRATSNEILAGTMDRAIAIAITSFERVKGGVFAIDTNLSASLNQVPIDNTAVKPLILALVNLLDNCYRHSGLWSRTKVTINGKVVDNLVILEIQNDLIAEKSLTLTSEFISAIRSKISNADSLNLIRTEGGSGLVKAFNSIASLGGGTRLDVAMIEGKFTATIYYEPKNTTG
ncbi:hypothetical protein GCM10007387_33880 [Pseudoduganella albidiflava]|nr:hypothetical protein GCM10007387_33880 [Pseudoduganella albidiflava]